MGTLDWLTTIIGVAVFGATETNPLLAELTKTSLLSFTTVKLAFVALAGLLFYKAGNTEFTNNRSQILGHFPEFAYSFSLVFLTFVVVNNTITIAQLM
jgi:hypothetical protein